MQIPVANRAYSLCALGRMAEKAEQEGRLAFACELLNQAVKETGDMKSIAPESPYPPGAFRGGGIHSIKRLHPSLDPP